MKTPNKIEVKIASGSVDEDDCAKCPVSNCHWDDEYGCAIVWYNVFRNTLEPKEPTE